MAKSNKQMPISKDTMLRLVIGAVGLLALFFLVLLPALQRSQELDVSIAQREVEIAEQEVLFPVYAQLASELKKKRAESLPVPELALLRQDELADVIQSIENSAKSSGFKVITVNPDPKSMEDGQGLLLVNCRFQGPYVDFRNVVINLGAIPYLKYISKVQVKEAYQNAEFQLELWLAMKEDSAS